MVVAIGVLAVVNTVVVIVVFVVVVAAVESRNGWFEEKALSVAFHVQKNMSNELSKPRIYLFIEINKMNEMHHFKIFPDF